MTSFSSRFDLENLMVSVFDLENLMPHNGQIKKYTYRN